MTSNAFETVEIWQLKKYDGGVERLEVQATFYDKYAFLKPVSVVYAFRHADRARQSRLPRQPLGMRADERGPISTTRA